MRLRAAFQYAWPAPVYVNEPDWAEVVVNENGTPGVTSTPEMPTTLVGSRPAGCTHVGHDARGDRPIVPRRDRLDRVPRAAHEHRPDRREARRERVVGVAIGAVGARRDAGSDGHVAHVPLELETRMEPAMIVSALAPVPPGLRSSPKLFTPASTNSPPTN